MCNNTSTTKRKEVTTKTGFVLCARCKKNEVVPSTNPWWEKDTQMTNPNGDYGGTDWSDIGRPTYRHLCKKCFEKLSRLECLDCCE